MIAKLNLYSKNYLTDNPNHNLIGIIYILSSLAFGNSKATQAEKCSKTMRNNKYSRCENGNDLEIFFL